MTHERVSLSALNAMTDEAFVGVLGPIYEHSPWIARRALARRPFTSIGDLRAAMAEVVTDAAEAEKLDLICAHPDLVGKMAREGGLTRESTSEQAAAGLAGLTPQEVNAFARYNAEYRAKFSFPFVICARENRKDAILQAFPRRLQNSPVREMQTALSEIARIAHLRLIDLVRDAEPAKE